MIRINNRHVVAVFLSLASALVAANDVALVTALQGKVSRVLVTPQPPLESFVKLKEGDVLQLEKGATIRIVFFDGGRQESWSGSGRLEIAATASRSSGLPAPEVKTLPPLIVRQIAKTPTLDSQGRAGVTRLRAIGSTNTLEKLEAEYDRMRREGGGKDLNAEIYLLAGLFELRELERVEKMIADLQAQQKDNVEAKILASLYRKALNNVQKSR